MKKYAGLYGNIKKHGIKNPRDNKTEALQSLQEKTQFPSLSEITERVAVMNNIPKKLTDNQRRIPSIVGNILLCLFYTLFKQI